MTTIPRLVRNLVLAPLAGILVLLTAISLSFKVPPPMEASLVIMQGTKGEPAVVDYEKVKAVAEEVITTIPKPRNGYTPVKGVDYFDGSHGINGKDGVVDYNIVETIVRGVVQDMLDDKFPEPKLELEYQTNPKSGKREWRPIGDDSWQLCTPTDKCL